MKKQKKPVPPAEAEPVIKKQPLLKWLLFGPERPDLSELEAGSTTILDILSPTAIDTKSRDYIVVDGVFHAYLYITGYGYSTTVGSCWLAPLVEAGEGVNVSFSFTRQNREKILSKIAQTTMLNRSRMRDVGDTRQDYEELDSAITSGLYLKDVMNRQGEDFYYMHTLIEVVADDPDTLEQRVTAVEKLCVSVDMIARRCDYANEQGFLSTLPLVTLDADIERKSRRNALTTGVAAAFPFVSYEHSDRNGIFLGLNLYNKSPVFLDPYDDYKYTNGNWWIGGNSGAGKSVTLQCLAGRLREQGKRVVCVIPKKGHEFRPNCEQLGGLYLRLSPSSRDCPNIMAIRRKTLDAYAGIQELAARDDSVLADKISRLIIWYSLQKKDLTEEDKNYLDASLVECYDRYGITFDNASVVDENGAFKEMPIIPDWYNVLLERAETKHLAVVLTRYVTGSAAAMGRRNHISIDNKYIVLDTSGIPRMVFGIRALRDGRAVDCSMGVVADEPPTGDTKMYHYPFSNVYDDLRVCVGNNVLPHFKSQTQLSKFPRFLLGIPNNDDFFKESHNRLHMSHRELLEHLKDKEPAYYYTDVLVESGKTLSDFINRR